MSRTETHTDDFDMPAIPPLVMPALGEPLIREPEAIAALDTPMESDYMKELAFMEEPVQILLQIPAEKNPAKMIDIYVNGRPEWIPVNTPWTVKRKYVEVLARARPIDVTTQHDTPETAPESGPRNTVSRITRVKHPFSVIQDTEKGHEWLRRIMAEA